MSRESGNGSSGPSPARPPLRLVVEEEIRHDRIQEARARIARRFYDQDGVRKEITQALLAFFGVGEGGENAP